MHVIDRQDNFTLIGSDARRGKLTLFDAEGPRERGAFKHVALRVSSVDGADRFTLPEGIEVRLVEAPTDVEYDLDHVALYTSDPEVDGRGVSRLRVLAGGAEGRRAARRGRRCVRRVPPGRSRRDSDRPLLNHLAVLVDSADDHKRDAEELGIEVERFVDAANTLAVFLWGPDRVRIEYVEHKPTFSLT